MAELKAQWWWWKKDKTFTLEEVGEMMEDVKMFNAGCIDQYLTRHVDRVFDAWLEKKGINKQAEGQ